MISVTEVLYIIGLFVLRLGVPIAITLTIAYFLHRLDARWEKEARLEQEAGRVTKAAEKKKGVSLPQPPMPAPMATPTRWPFSAVISRPESRNASTLAPMP